MCINIVSITTNKNLTELRYNFHSTKIEVLSDLNIIISFYQQISLGSVQFEKKKNIYQQYLWYTNIKITQNVSASIATNLKFTLNIDLKEKSC